MNFSICQEKTNYVLYYESQFSIRRKRKEGRNSKFCEVWHKRGLMNLWCLQYDRFFIDIWHEDSDTKEENYVHTCIRYKEIGINEWYNLWYSKKKCTEIWWKINQN